MSEIRKSKLKLRMKHNVPTAVVATSASTVSFNNALVQNTVKTTGNIIKV
jgi:hypothetical protein